MDTSSTSQRVWRAAYRRRRRGRWPTWGPRCAPGRTSTSSGGIWRRYSIRGDKNGDEGPAAYTDWVRIPQDGEPGSPSNLRLSQQADPTEVRLNWTAGSEDADRLQDLPLD